MEKTRTIWGHPVPGTRREWKPGVRLALDGPRRTPHSETIIERKSGLGEPDKVEVSRLQMPDSFFDSGHNHYWTDTKTLRAPDDTPRMTFEKVNKRGKPSKIGWRISPSKA